MNPITANTQRFARQLGMGWDGLSMLILSNLVLLLTAGLSGWWMLYRVWRIAVVTPCSADANSGWVMVLGMRLHHDQISRDYARRLQRAAVLYQADPRRRFLLVGGLTGGSASEAERGRQCLLDTGVPTSAISIEDRSLHTLDNLRNARLLLGSDRNSRFVLVTNRYHLARSQALAHGLGLHPVLCAAEDQLCLDPLTLGRFGLEAYYLHWYTVGKVWSQWTRNRGNLARIT